MIEPTLARPRIDPVLQTLLDTLPTTFSAADGVHVARARLAALKRPPELLPALRIDDRTVGYGDLTDIPVRIYWPPTATGEALPWSSSTTAAGRSAVWTPMTTLPARIPSAPTPSWCPSTTGWPPSIPAGVAAQWCREPNMVHGCVDFALVVPAAAEVAGRGLAALKQALHA